VDGDNGRVVVMSVPVIVHCPVCLFCGSRAVIEVDAVGLQEWIGGELVQVAFPDLDAAQRELLVSGVHEHCWEENMRIGEDDE
jgi:hypothetical protein